MSKVLRLATQPGSDDSAQAPTFKNFHSDIIRNDRSAASKTLSTLLAMTPDLAERATKFYAEAIKHDPEHVLAAMSLFGQIISNDQNEALLTLQRVFGLSIVEAIPIYTHLKNTFQR